MNKCFILFASAAIFFLISCGNNSGNNNSVNNIEDIKEISTVTPYQDVRWKDLHKIESQLDSDLIKTLWYNEKSVWPAEYTAFAKELLNKGKNPGLGVRNLHKQGITGKGVAVAIIDQNICLDHPEFGRKIKEYHDVGCNQPLSESSMHGPAVASLLAGDSIGTAPDAVVYFVAAPSWTLDAKFQADALNWIIDRNSTLPESDKIRAVSVSAAPSGEGSLFTKNNSAWDTAYARAEKSGILVIDCTANHGITAPCYYAINDPDNISACTCGFPGVSCTIDSSRIYVPISLRTTAEQYHKGEYSYQFTGRGGLSWAEPYLVGVLAMGWQLRSDIGGDEMVRLLKVSAYLTSSGARIIQPSAFIDSVKAH